MQKLIVGGLSNQEILVAVVDKLNKLIEAYGSLAITINNIKLADELDILRSRIIALEEKSVLHGDQLVNLLETVTSFKKGIL